MIHTIVSIQSSHFLYIHPFFPIAAKVFPRLLQGLIFDDQTGLNDTSSEQFQKQSLAVQADVSVSFYSFGTASIC